MTFLKRLTEPSFKAGYARNSSESANPNLWNGLVGAWMPSLGVTGSKIPEITGKATDAYLQNVPETNWITDKGKTAILLDGGSSNDYISAAHCDAFNFGSESFTAISLLKYRVLTPLDTFLDFRTAASPYLGFTTYLRSTGNFQTQLRSSAVQEQYSHYVPVNNNQWQMFVTRVDRGKATCETFLNGISYGSSSISSSMGDINSGEPARFGINIQNNYETNSSFASVLIYKRAISDAEIKQLYVDSLAPFRQKSIRIFRGADIPTATSKLISVKRNNQVDPSFKAGYAQSPSESAHPNLWDGLVGAWMPSLGVTGFVKVRNLVKGRTGDGVITNGMEFTQKGFVQNDADELIQLNDGYVNKSGTVVGSIKPTTQYSYWRSSELWQSRNWGLSINSQTGINTSKWDNSGGFKNVTIPLPKGNVKYHLASSFSDNGELALYVDGIKAGSTPYVTSQTQRGWPVRLASYTDRVAGHHNWTGPYLFGDVLLFDRVLTEKEIQTLYVDSLAPFRKKQQIAFNAYPLTLLEKIRSAAKPTTPVSVRVKHNEKPSYKTGYAKSADESASPHLWNGLVGAWMPSLGVTGDTLRDVSGNENHVTLFDDAHFETTARGHAIDFDRNGDYAVSAENTSFVIGTGAFTILQWVYVRSLAGVSYGMWDTLELGGSASRANDFILYWSGSQIGYNKVGVYSNSATRVQSDNALSLNEWNLIGLRRKSTAANGADVITNTTKNSSYTLATNITSTANVFGRISETNAFHLDGQIASFQAWNRALSDAEIKQLYVDSLAPFRRKAKPIGYHPPKELRGLFKV